MKEKIEIILHPVRIRILQTLLNGKRLTAQQMRKQLSDVSAPTLYRQLNTLADYQLIKIVEENQIRGTVEKVYALPQEQLFSKGDLAKATPQDHLTYFTTFMTNLLGQFNDYIHSSNANVSEDNVSYRQIQLHLTDDEFAHMFKEVGHAMLSHIDNKPTENRKLYSISTVVIPRSDNVGGKGK